MTRKKVQILDQCKKDHDLRKRDAGLKEFRAWVTPEQAKKLTDYLVTLRQIKA